ncbi:MAG: NAD-dependent protein deacylase [Erysipelotrichaceae bacterium]
MQSYLNDQIQQLQQIIDESQKIVFFTGAGVSTESNIPDFRSSDGLYNQKYKYPPEQIISHDFFWENTEEFYRFYRDRMIYPSAQPNMAHIKMAQLEKKGKVLAVVTQNIDDLHQKAGSEKVYELHGTVMKNYCTKCHRFYSLNDILNMDTIPICSCGGVIKPDVVLYQEMLNEKIIDQSIEAISQADTLIVCGTSLVVYPAASFVNYFHGKNLVVINLSSTRINSTASLVINGKVAEVLSKIKVD